MDGDSISQAAEQRKRTTDRVALTSKPTPHCTPAVACTLAADQVGDRLAQWHAVVGAAFGRDSIPGGVRVRLARDVDIVGLAELMAAEQDCCRFFTFTLNIDSDAVALDVTGPPEARPIIDALVGPVVNARSR